MDSISGAIIEKALDGLSQRYAFIAQNIANASVENYRPIRVSFEAELRAAASRGLDAVRSIRPEASVATEQGEMRVDLELQQASETALRYQALIDILSRQMAMASIFVSDRGR